MPDILKVNLFVNTKRKFGNFSVHFLDKICQYEAVEVFIEKKKKYTKKFEINVLLSSLISKKIGPILQIMY